MTPPVGQVLQEARTQRGIDLADVERVTKIRAKFLRAMEENRWEALPAPVYARSFLSTYARFLGLDGEALVDEYRRTAEGADRPEPVPIGAIRSGAVKPRARPLRPVALAAGLVVVVLLGLVIVGSLGSSGGSGGGPAHRHEGKPAQSGIATITGGSPATSRVSLNLRSTAPVWVCLVNADRRALVAETLQAGETRGPFDSRSFEVTFGNGSVEMTIDGQPVKVPQLAEPLGYRITPNGPRRLDAASQPTCS